MIGRLLKVVVAVLAAGVLAWLLPQFVDSRLLPFILNMGVASVYVTIMAMSALPGSIRLPFEPSLGARLFFFGCASVHIELAFHSLDGTAGNFHNTWHMYTFDLLQVIGGWWFNLWIITQRIRSVRFFIKDR